MASLQEAAPEDAAPSEFPTVGNRDGSFAEEGPATQESPRRDTGSFLENGDGSPAAAVLAAPAATQESPRRVTDNVLDKIEEQAAADWADMKTRIEAATDPAEEAKHRLQQAALSAFNESHSLEPATLDTLVARLIEADAPLRDTFFNRWSRLGKNSNA